MAGKYCENLRLIFQKMNFRFFPEKQIYFFALEF